MQSNAAVMQEPRASMPESLYRKHTSPSDVILKVLIYAAAVITVLTLVGIIAYILIRGVPYLSWQFLSTPYSETNMDQRGILPMIINTLYIVVITLLIVTPIGIASAIYLTQYARQGKLVKTIRFTTEVLSGVPSIVFGLFVKWIRPLFPPLVTGTVIFTIGLSLYPTAVRYMAGGSGSEWFGTPKSWLVALVTLAVVVFLNNFTKGILKLASILIGMIVGYLLALCLGMVDLSGVGGSAWFALPEFMPFEIKFVPAACVSLGIVYVVNAVQTIGDLSSTTMGGMDRMPTDRELSGGIIGQGIMSILGAFFGGLPAATYSQNVGIVTVNKVINRAVFALAAVILLVAGLMPKFASLLTTIPQCVIGGATISVFATITMTGIRMITEGGFTPRKSAVVGLAVALGVGITQVAGCLSGAGFPAWVNTVFGSSSVVVSTLAAILLNLILPREKEDKA